MPPRVLFENSLTLVSKPSSTLNAVLVLLLNIRILLSYCAISLENLTTPESFVSEMLFAERKDLTLSENRERMRSCCR